MTAIGYMGLDGSRLSFEVPKGLNRSLVVSAIKKIHHGKNPDLAVRGLTRAELDLVLNIVESLESHRVPETA
jgi:hypothetical protein